MAEFGVTPTGFRAKRLEDIKTEMEAAIRGELGNGINLGPSSPLGQIVGVLAERQSLLWEALEDVYNSAFPDTAEGVNLDKVLSITGNTRKGATKSLVASARAYGTFGTLIPAGTVVSVEGDETARFLTDANVTIDTPAATEIQDISFDLDPDSGDFKLIFTDQDGVSETSGVIAHDDTAGAITAILEAVTLIGAGNVVVTGAVDDVTGLTLTYASALSLTRVNLVAVTANALLDGATAVSVTPVETVEGHEPFGTPTLTAEDFGPVLAPTGSLNVIETPVGGLDDFDNLLDAVAGRNIETDAEARIRREQELQIAGAATIEAIRAELLALTAVTAVVVFQNNSSIEIIDGAITRPPHSVDIVVQGGDEDEIAEEIFGVVAAGITMIGDISKVVTDSQGFLQTVLFSRPSEVDIWLEVDLSVNSALFPVDGAAQAEAAFLAYGNGLSVGEDVIVFPALLCSIGDIDGITDVVIRVGTAASPTLDDNVVIEPREIAAFDSGRITVAVI